ncbi:MAG: hypothetical protein WCJ29_00355 [bacterium]
MPKRKEVVEAKKPVGAHSLFDHHHHDGWLANIVALVVVLVFGVYVLMTRDALTRMTQEMGQRLQAVEAQCQTR